MQDREKRDLLCAVAQRLLTHANVSIVRVNSLHDCLDWAAKKGQGHIVVAIMFMIRGSKIKAEGVMTAANQLSAEEGFSPAFAAVCKAIDQL